jgi:hypothetical protein
MKGVVVAMMLENPSTNVADIVAVGCVDDWLHQPTAGTDAAIHHTQPVRDRCSRQKQGAIEKLISMSKIVH